jgi:hypothetical protein
MARSPKKKVKLDEMGGQADPRAPLDPAALLAVLKPLLVRLTDDLLARAKASPAVSRAMAERHERERAEERTAESLAEWTHALATQVGAAWILSCVFVRTLEDRGLLRQARLAGPGAMDSQRLFFQLAPSLTERDYLLMVFREIARYPAARDLFDGEHSLVWKLSPSADAAKELLALFRTPNAEAPAFRFGQASTRFLGDLYQDLSEEIRKRYALLQTPHFIESFILDRTLEPAIERFGLDETTIIDPTCGSGHFLLGAFDRLFEHRLRREPGIDARVAATKALDAVYGADINPYAVAIARFRMTLSFLEKTGYGKLADAPALPLHLVVADSLLHNPQQRQTELGHVAGQSAAAWGGEVFALEDEAAAREVLYRQFAAVVGNPPYITEKDPTRREVYRRMYVSAAGKYALSAPFAERFFQLARPRGYVGQITSNAFMKREFGKKLIEEYFQTVNLELIANTSGAYIPGHGTPTVLLFGTHEAPRETDVLAVLGKRGEPSAPANPAKGEVWSSIEEHYAEVGFENEYISIARVARDTLRKHPWSLGGGGASELKALVEERADSRLKDLIEAIGIGTVVGEDEAFTIPLSAVHRFSLNEGSFARPLVTGEHIRDWTLSCDSAAIGPYTEDLRLDCNEASPLFRRLWPLRTVLWSRAVFSGGTYRDAGRPWFEWHQLTRNRYHTPLSITFAEVATHNHFVLDRGGKVFKQTAPIIKLPQTASEDDYLALLAYLNSSTACFWMKQVCYPKSAHSEARPEKGIPEDGRFAFSGTALEKLPLPNLQPDLVRLAADLDTLSRERNVLEPEPVVREALRNRIPIPRAVSDAEVMRDTILHRMVAVQEDLDWQVYVLLGLAEPTLARRWTADMRMAPSERPFARLEPVEDWGAADQELWIARRDATQRSSELQLVENAVMKRRWWGARGVFATKVATYRERAVDASRVVLAERFEEHVRAITEPRGIPLIIGNDRQTLNDLCAFIANDREAADTMRQVVAAEAVPFLAAHRFTDEGLEKWAYWNRVWNAQRAEDAGDRGATPAVPRKYGAKDFQDFSFWRHRGALDVPKERFISYPDCESDDDHEPVYGWAGWDHLQRAKALAALYLKRKDGEGWQKDRLTPMLAGLLELIPWVKQWHNEPSEEYGGLRMADYFQQFLDGECRQFGLTHDDLRAWRPPKKTPAAKTTKAKPAAAALADGSSAPALTPAQKAAATRARRKAAASSADAAAARKPETP